MSVPAIHVLMGQPALTFLMPSPAHAQHILRARDASMVSVSLMLLNKLAMRRRFLMLS